MQKFVANSSHAINKQKKMSTDEVDNATDSERRVLAAGGDNMEIHTIARCEYLNEILTLKDYHCLTKMCQCTCTHTYPVISRAGVFIFDFPALRFLTGTISASPVSILARQATISRQFGITKTS